MLSVETWVGVSLFLYTAFEGYSGRRRSVQRNYVSDDGWLIDND